MAQKTILTVTATKIIDGAKRAVVYSGTGKDITVVISQNTQIIPTGASNGDVIIKQPNGDMIYATRAFSSINTLISATDGSSS